MFKSTLSSLLCCLLLIALTDSLYAAASRPNILFIMTDDHAAHAVSAYGSKINKTPNIDRIGRDGMRLNNCFATNALCAPSRAAILTGKYSHLNGVKDHKGPGLDPQQNNVAKELKKLGYQTAIIGKWHLKEDPSGFDYWNILPGQGAYHNPPMIEMGVRKKNVGYATDLITSFSMDWLAGRDTTKPFFLMTHHKAPHRNWEPDDKHAQMYENEDIPHPPTYDDDYCNRASAARNAKMRVSDDLTSRDVKMLPPPGLDKAQLKNWHYQRYMKDYLRCVASVDDNVGRILDYLDAAGLTTNTVVIYTSDQGFFLGDHGWYDKRFMYEEALRMPFLVRYPGEIKPGSTCDAFITNVDFPETFLDFAGGKAPADMQGKSFRSWLAGKQPADWRKNMYYHYYEYPDADHMVSPHFGVRTDRYKLIRYYGPADEWELFDLQKDPHELKSVYGQPDYADVQKDLTAQLRDLREQLAVKDGPQI